MPGSQDFISLFNDRAATDPDRVFARYGGNAITFADLDRASARFAAMLARLGVERGDRVAVMMRNGTTSLALIFAIMRAGHVWVPVNAALKGEGLRHVLDHCDPALIVADEEFLDRIADCGAQARAPVTVCPDSDDLEEAGGVAGPVPAADDPAAIMYTSGTTGPAKGVIVTHRMLRLAAEAVALSSAPRPGDIYFLWEPFYHIGGAQTLILPLVRDISLSMVDRFSASSFWQEVREAGATHIHYLGGVIQILLKQPPSPRDRDHPVRIAWGGGCAADAWRAFEERFGVEIREGYGMTEASSLTSFNDTGVVGSIGRPVPWFEVRLLDDDGREIEDGRGEIVVTTSLPGAIFPGYFRNPDATAKALRPEGFRTGDMGSRDVEGNLYFHGRKGDSVRCKGENVSAYEVEHVVGLHPDVEDSAMIGVAADVGEQDIKLFVQLKPGATEDPGALSAWLAERLAPFQQPRYIAFVDEFERTPSKRIMKHRLSPARAECWDRLAERESIR